MWITLLENPYGYVVEIGCRKLEVGYRYRMQE